MTDQGKIEAAAREAVKFAAIDAAMVIVRKAQQNDPEITRQEQSYILSAAEDGYLAGHASRDEEVAELRARLEAAEKRITELEDNEYDPFK